MVVAPALLPVLPPLAWSVELLLVLLSWAVLVELLTATDWAGVLAAVPKLASNNTTAVIRNKPKPAANVPAQTGIPIRRGAVLLVGSPGVAL